MRVNFKNTPFAKATYLLDKLEQAGYEAYFVGGSVRDTLLNLPIHDVDIASSATPEEVESLFNHTVDLGKEHGTILVIYEKEPYEITTFRTEGAYSDNRRPDQVFFVKNLKEDTLRRDFTINALAFDKEGRLYDYHQGQKDLNRHLIQAVGNPYARFKEDALRMFRAVRFATQLGFQIEDTTFEALKELSENIEHISIERVRVELSKYLKGNYFPTHYHYLVKSGMLPYLPYFQLETTNSVFSQIAQDSIKYIEKGHTLSDEMAWYLLSYYMNLNIKETKGFLKQWTHSNDFITKVINLRQLYDDYIEYGEWSNRVIYQYSIEELLLMEEYLILTQKKENQTVLHQKQALPIQTRRDIAVNGAEVMSLLKMTRGSSLIGELLKLIEEHILIGQLDNNKADIEAFILQKVNSSPKRRELLD